MLQVELLSPAGPGPREELISSLVAAWLPHSVCSRGLGVPQVSLVPMHAFSGERTPGLAASASAQA